MEAVLTSRSRVQSTPSSSLPRRDPPQPDGPRRQHHAGVPLFLQRMAGAPQTAFPQNVKVNEIGDRYELEADRVAGLAIEAHAPTHFPSITSVGSGARVQRCDRCTGGALCPECAEKQRAEEGHGEERRVQARRGGAGPGVARDATSLITRPPRGIPLPAAVRSRVEPVLGMGLGSVEVHADRDAQHLSRDLGARAFTHGHHIFLGPGERADDISLLAHEATHVVQQSAAGPMVQRQTAPPTGQAASNAPDTVARDRAAEEAGPCGVVESSLSNEGLLFQLNRARVYLTRNQRGEGEWYDYANLLRRLSEERRRRVGGGQLWLAEPGLLHVPDRLYALDASGGLQVTVRSVAGSTVAGAYAGSMTTVVTQSQFYQFLGNHNVPVLDAQNALAALGGPQAAATLSLPAEVRTALLANSPLGSPGFPGGQGGSGLTTPAPFGSSLLASPFANPNDPFGLTPGAPPGSLAPFSLGNQVTYTPSAMSSLMDLRYSPYSVTGTGPERVYFPPGASGSSASPFGLPTVSGGPTGVGALGYLGRPGLGLPANSSGILYEGSHVSDFVVMNDRLMIRGFRAPFYEHGWDTAFRSSNPGNWATTDLNVGAPGAYRNDWMFPYGGEFWSRGTSHWRQGGVAIVSADGTPASAADLMRAMSNATQQFAGTDYRFSTPPQGSRYYQAADAEAARRGMTRWCQAGGQNCINVPMDIHSRATGLPDITIPGPNGQPISLRDPANASTRNMSQFMNLPDSFWEANGLRRVNLGTQAWRGVGVGGALGGGMSVAGDAIRVMQGDRISAGQFAFDATLGTGSSAASVMAEDWAYTGLTTGLMRSGVQAGTASMVGRLGAGTGVGMVVAPLTTGAEMLFDDRQYTGIDYAARMGRSGVSAGSGALASGLFFAAMGSEVPLAGNIAGFLIGVGGYYLTDWLVGEDTEESIREGLGEGGCTGGVGPGH